MLKYHPLVRKGKAKMLRVVIDTNIVVSAFISPHGNPAKILDMVTDLKLCICYSTEILTEYIEVLSRPRFNFKDEDCEDFIESVKRFGLLCQPTASDIPLPDEADRCFYDTAKFCEAMLITGNTKHFPVEAFIVTPTEFIALLD